MRLSGKLRGKLRGKFYRVFGKFEWKSAPINDFFGGKFLKSSWQANERISDCAYLILYSCF